MGPRMISQDGTYNGHNSAQNRKYSVGVLRPVFDLVKPESKYQTERGEDQREMQATVIIEQTEPIATERTISINVMRSQPIIELQENEV